MNGGEERKTHAELLPENVKKLEVTEEKKTWR
jgi:hypothetical protein